MSENTPTSDVLLLFTCPDKGTEAAATPRDMKICEIGGVLHVLTYCIRCKGTHRFDIRKDPELVTSTKKYKIVRNYFEQRTARVQMRGLTLDEAQAYCRDNQSSSSTATSQVAAEHTKKWGAWFDSYEEEK